MAWNIRTTAYIANGFRDYLTMKHPLEFFPIQNRKQIFFMLLALTLILFAVFRVLDQPLRTSAAPRGIVSFELAGDVGTVNSILASWKQASLLLSAVAGKPNPDIVNIPFAFAAFGLGLDYLFMPVYALTLSLGILLATQKHTAWMRSVGAVTGYGAFVAPLFDTVENYALFQILLGRVFSPYPEIAFYCATIKFCLLILGIATAVVLGLSSKH